MPHSARNRMVDAARFSMVPRNDVPRSAFDVQHSHKTTFDAGYLIPLYVQEVLPGDSIRTRMTVLCRMSTPLFPVMDNLVLESHFFFCPNRLLWDTWARFMGEQTSPADDTNFLVPYTTFDAADMPVGSLSDYFGITINNSGNSKQVNALPFRAYNLIWNEWFRDQDLQSPRQFGTGDGPDDPTTAQYIAPAYRGKRHDYFTSARPWPQKPVNADLFSIMEPFAPGQNMTYPQSGAPVTGLGVGVSEAPDVGSFTMGVSGGRDQGPFTDIFSSANADFFMKANFTGEPDVRVLINDIRTANTVQTFMERNARGGTRYTELVRSHFGVVSPDARLQRPEFIGGGRTMLAVNPVAQTSATGASGTELASLSAIGHAVGTHGFSQSFTEHGFIIGLVSIRADLTYQQGIRRMWFRRTVWDHYWPALAHLGEQAIMSQEIFCDGSADDLDVFGYQERWSEYKYVPSRTSGYMRSTVTTPLDQWHLGQEFDTRPVLDDEFIREQPPIDRVAQVDVNWGAGFLCDAFFEERMVRCMPMYSIPGMGPRI